MHAARILVADDDQAILRTCRKILEHAGYDVTTAADGDSALNLLKFRQYDLFLVDMLMPGLSGLETVSLARQADPTLMILMFTAYATIQTAVEAVKRGVFDYLPKPFTADQLCAAVEQSLQQKQLLDEKFSLHGQLTDELGFDRILGTSEAMQKLFATLQKVVRTNANILVQGETGTGKDLVARTIHAHSFRRDKPFLAVDCAALPENLLESELFGHEKAPSRAPIGSSAASWSWLTPGRSFWMKSANSPSCFRPSCCGHCRSANFEGWEASAKSWWTSE